MMLKRYAMPKIWKLPRKIRTWAVRAVPGPHPMERCLPLQIILRDVLHYTENARETKRILKAGKVFVDKKPRKEAGFPVGLMDVLEIPDIKKAFRVLNNKKGLTLEEIKTGQDRKLCRVQGKRIIKGGVLQLNLHDGRNIAVKGKAEYKTGDSVLIELPSQRILKHYKMQKGESAFIIAGKNIGVSGKIKDIRIRKNMLEKSTISLSTNEGDVETLRDYVMVGEILTAPTKPLKPVPNPKAVKKKPKLAKKPRKKTRRVRK